MTPLGGLLESQGSASRQTTKLGHVLPRIAPHGAADRWSANPKLSGQVVVILPGRCSATDLYHVRLDQLVGVVFAATVQFKILCARPSLFGSVGHVLGVGPDEHVIGPHAPGVVTVMAEKHTCRDRPVS